MLLRVLRFLTHDWVGLVTAGIVVFAITTVILHGSTAQSPAPRASASPAAGAIGIGTQPASGTPTTPPAAPTTTFLDALSAEGSNQPSARRLATMNGIVYQDSLILYGSCPVGECATYDITYALPGAFSKFAATIGLADHAGASCGQGQGYTATFQAKVDGVIRFRADVPEGQTQQVSLPLTGAHQLELLTITTTYYSCDAVWGNAELLP